MTHKNVYKKQNYDDDSSLLLENGFEVKYIEGDPKSLKITYEKDLNLIKSILENQHMKNYITKSGIGYDVHKLVKINSKTKNKKLILGGLKIENGYFLEGHSDADNIELSRESCVGSDVIMYWNVRKVFSKNFLTERI